MDKNRGHLSIAERSRRLGNAPAPAFARPLMALSGLIALQLDPPSYSILPGAVMPLQCAYLVFSILALLEEVGIDSQGRVVDWMDLGWGLVLTSVTGGTSSVLFFLLLFPIIARSFRDGYDAGWRLAMITAGTYLLTGAAFAPSGEMIEVNRTFTRPLTLLILGYVIAREGGIQLRARRQIALLANLNTIANPRFGANKTLVNAAQQIRSSYGLSQCWIVVRGRSETNEHVVARADESQGQLEQMHEEGLRGLMGFPEDSCLLISPSTVVDGDGVASRPSKEMLLACDLLDSRHIATVPIQANGTYVGRVFLCGDALTALDSSELRFLLDACGHLYVLVRRIDMLDELATTAAQRERLRIAHDLHDLAIQPYLGLQLGLSSIISDGDCPESVGQKLSDLLIVSKKGVEELRKLLASERAAGKERAPDVLRQVMAQTVEHYRKFFGIEVEYLEQLSRPFSDRLLADIVAMISEALSNVRRHTTSIWARVVVECVDDAIVIEVSNANAEAKVFQPWSLKERADGLGGQIKVISDEANVIKVRISIPL